MRGNNVIKSSAMAGKDAGGERKNSDVYGKKCHNQGFDDEKQPKQVLIILVKDNGDDKDASCDDRCVVIAWVSI